MLVGAGGRTWSGLTAAPPGGPVVFPGDWAPGLGGFQLRARAGGPLGPRAGRCGPSGRGAAIRGRARTAPPGATATREIRARAGRLQVSGSDPSARGRGRRGRPPASSGKETQSARQLSRLRRRAASAWQGRPAPSRLARCLFVSPWLPSSQTNGCWQEIRCALWEPRSSGRRGGGAARQAGSGARAGAGARGDVLTSRQRKELDASKVLFTAACVRSRADL